MSESALPNGTVLTQNVTALGGRANAVQNGDQYNYIYRGTPPYRVEPYPLARPAAPAPGLARVPSRLLTARHQVVPFFPRPELESLAGWRDGAPPGLSVRLLHGEGGRGKTRLAAEFAARSARAGWTVAQARHRSEVASAGGGDESLTVRQPGLVLVVDYAERWPLADLITLVGQHRDAARDRLRILLLARPAGEWWQRLEHQLVKLDVFETGALPLAALPDDPRVRGGIYTSARDSFGAALDLAEPAELGVPEELDDPQFALTLAVHMKALVDVDAARRGVAPPSGRDLAALSSYLLDREHDHWRSFHDGGRGPLRTGEAVLRRAVYLATLTRPLPPAEAVTALSRAAVADAAGAAQVVADHARCYPPQDEGLVFEALAPDRLAEDFLALTLPGREETTNYHATDSWAAVAPALLLEHPVDGEPLAWTRQVLTVVIEAAHRWPHLVPAQLVPMLLRRPALAPAAGGAALLRLCELAELPSAVLERIAPHLPKRRHVDLDLAAAVLTRRLTRHRLAAGALAPEERAQLLRNLAWRYGNAGLLAEALAPAREAVDLYREVAAADPGHLADLATAVNTLAAAAIEAGRYEEAWAPAREAVDLYRRLAEADPAAQLPDLARALNNQGTLLLRLGRAGEAVVPGREVVDVYRRLLASEPDRYLPELATALTNLSNNLSESGGWEEGLDVAAEAVELGRRLVETDPDRHLPDLAMTLINHGLRLTNANRLDEALAACEEAVTLQRRLVEVNPTAHLPRLAMAWDNLGNLLARREQRQEALAATREALAARERLAGSDPVLHLPGLAKSLTNLSIRLSQSGGDDGGDGGDGSPDGLTHAQRAVDLFRPLAGGNPAHLPDFATALFILGHWHGRLGQHREALAAVEEEVTVRRRLAQADPAAHRPRLAQTLRTVGILLARAGRQDESFARLAEEVAVRGAAAAAGAAAELPMLLRSVALYGLHLVEVGRAPEALRLTTLALDALRTAARDDPVPHRAELARGAVLLGLRLSQAGRVDQALLATRQGVAALARLARTDRQAHLADCAHGLKAFALVRVLAGVELAEALGASGEAVRASRLLAPEESGEHQVFPGLPDFLTVHAAVLEVLGRAEEAAAARREREAR
ncbi:tetratricopeptide repeat protein [Kitasatospora sp. NBC_01287]|uniref:tetratricopeptide repeat protein n=1 Tax=Kitasatospora sp. NBC_01287 TaxID=2903573 RepID=UPI00224D9936|nr:tetratricopeptide repeat protein [Kitasatospora sp. NBC_01287]MCX4744237.1 tetratricopeptide repeat protein [Kitasatospora sp. NBC_01287]